MRAVLKAGFSAEQSLRTEPAGILNGTAMMSEDDTNVLWFDDSGGAIRELIRDGDAIRIMACAGAR
jgi:hypothetical protein